MKRICYEGPLRRRILRIVPAVAYGCVPCRLRIEPVEKFGEKRKDASNLFLGMKLTRGDELRVYTEWATYRLGLAPGACIEVEDTGPPDENQLMWEPFGSVRNPEWMSRILAGGDV